MACEWTQIDRLERIADLTYSCPKCGGETERARLTGTVHVISDDIPGGFTDENLGPTPITYYSKSERRRLMKERGIRDGVRHVGLQGSDKSPHTQRWDVCPASLLISEADRLAQWYAWDVENGLTMEPRDVQIVAPESAVFTPEQHDQIAALAARVL